MQKFKRARGPNGRGNHFFTPAKLKDLPESRPAAGAQGIEAAACY